MSDLRIPFNKPCVVGSELERIKELLVSANQFSGCGPITEECEEKLSTIFGSPALLCTSATHALEMAALLLEFQPGDEVVIPSYTFVTTASAFVRAGATIRFVDNDNFGNIDQQSLERVVTPKTKAVVAVHYAGNSTNMQNLVHFCKSKKITLIEDAAQSIGAKFKGRPLGSFGSLACVSFHDTKNITCGEGGALIVNDATLLTRAEIIREKGTNRKQYYQGLVDKYSWVDIGSSFVLSEINAAFLLAQLNEIKVIHSRRQEIWNEYALRLKAPFENIGARMLETPAENTSNHHLFGFLMKDRPQRDSFLNFMRERSIGCAFHYVALHSAIYGKKLLQLSGQNFEEVNASLKNCQRFTNQMVRLPLYYNLSDEAQEHVVESAVQWTKSLPSLS